jgi:TPR repeat protein
MGEVPEAEEWLLRIAELGDARAAANLAYIHDERGEVSAAAEWRSKAAGLADANLTRNGRSLVKAYGEPAVLRYVKIIEDHADHVAAQGDTATANDWRQRAAAHLPTRSP